MVVEDTSRSEEEMTNTKATDPLDDPKASGEVLILETVEDAVPQASSLYIEQGNHVRTTDGKVAIVTNTVKIEPRGRPAVQPHRRGSV